LDQAISLGLQASLPGVSSAFTKDYVNGLTTGNMPESVTKIIGDVAGGAAGGATGAALKGTDIASGAQTGAGQAAQNDIGALASNLVPDVSLASGSDLLNTVKNFTQPISDVATAALQPVESAIKSGVKTASDAITPIVQPLEQPIKDVAKTVSDTATNVLQPLEQPVKDVSQAASDTATKVLQPIGNAISDTVSSLSDALPSVDTSGIKLPNLDLASTSGLDLIGLTSKPGSAVSSSATLGGDGGNAPIGSSPQSYGATDVAQVTPADLDSKVAKKGGKYPWGTPEGTTALKEGLGI
jgi:hypothetical protein